MKPVKHIGFKAAVAAAAAGGARKPAAKARNPRLAKVKGMSRKAKRRAVAKVRTGLGPHMYD